MAKKKYLEPNASAPRMLRKKVNGMISNPPLYVERLGGLTGASSLKRGTEKDLQLEKGGPQAKRGPI